MKWQNTLDELLEKANPSIKYRICRDILKIKSSPEMDEYYSAILKDPQVRYAFSIQKDDSYFGDEYHVRFFPNGKNKGKIGAEGVLLFLSERGLETTDSRIKAGLEALRQDNWLRKEKGLWCVHYQKIGMYGPEFIRAVMFARFNAMPDEELKPFIDDTVKTFNDILSVSAIDDIIEDFKSGGKLYKVFKKGIRLPESYHLKLLAYSDQWKKDELDRSIILRGIKKLVDLSPIRDVRVKYKSQWLLPAQIQPDNLKIKLNDLAVTGWDSDNWSSWFRTFELFARMDIVKEIVEFREQAEQLYAMLEKGNGFFLLDLPLDYFLWNGILENDWKKGRIYELTFRSLLILNFVGMLS